MRIVQLTPGSGDNIYCENCLRDAAAVKALRRLGHDVTLTPLYLPLRTDRYEPLSNAPLFFGGINVYLQQKSALFRKTPRFLDRLFDARKLLDWAGRRSGMVDAHDLGQTTISMLQGSDGRQVKELDRLVQWLQREPERPDIVCLSNLLLAGLAPRIRAQLNVPIACTLQDEDRFLDDLPAPYAQQAWSLATECAAAVDAFLAVSCHYSSVMQTRLHLDPNKITVVCPGLDLDTCRPAAAPPAVPTIGYLSQMTPAKGLATLVDALIIIKTRPNLQPTRLLIAGAHQDHDRPFLDDLNHRLTNAGCRADVEFITNLDPARKADFFRRLSVLSVPETTPGAYALYLVESLAHAVPVVQPAVPPFIEQLNQTPGGRLYQPNTPEQLAQALEPLLLDPAAARNLGQAGREAVADHLTADHAAAATAAVFTQTVQKFIGTDQNA